MLIIYKSSAYGLINELIAHNTIMEQIEFSKLDMHCSLKDKLTLNQISNQINY